MTFVIQSEYATKKIYTIFMQSLVYIKGLRGAMIKHPMSSGVD